MITIKFTFFFFFWVEEIKFTYRYNLGLEEIFVMALILCDRRSPTLVLSIAILVGSNYSLFNAVGSCL